MSMKSILRVHMNVLDQSFRYQNDEETKFQNSNGRVISHQGTNEYNAYCKGHSSLSLDLGSEVICKFFRSLNFHLGIVINK
jgi:hypothetical protein